MGCLRWAGLLPFGLDVVIILEPESLELAGIEAIPEGGAFIPDAIAGHEETDVASELRRAISRCARGARDKATVKARLDRLMACWKRLHKQTSPLLRCSSVPLFRHGPRLFLEHAGSNAAEVSWVPLGGLAEEASAYEVELLGFRNAVKGQDYDTGEKEQLGRFIVPLGPEARSYTLKRLRPSRHHCAKVRALGPQRSWESAWSNEVFFMTTSIEAAKEAGSRMTSDGFFVPSERHICRSVCGHGREDMLGTAIDDILGSALGAAEQGTTVKDLLDARSYQGGWPSFVRHGNRYSQPPSERQKRMQRMRLVVTAKELYKPEYADGNPWSMGPFYYEEVGRLTMEAEQRIQERIAAAGGG